MRDEPIDPGVRRRFRVGLAVVVVVGLAVRLLTAWWFDAHRALHGDAIWYWGVARIVADGHGFLDPILSIGSGHTVRTAAHPPLYVLVLALPMWLGAKGVLAARLWSAVVGSATVAVVGLLGREVAGRDDPARAARTGIVAAALTAAFVDLVVQDVLVMSEGLYALEVAAAVLLAYQVLRAPTWWRVAGLGALVGLAALTRAEGLVLAIVLVLPVLLVAPLADWPRRLGALALASVVAVAVVAPWTAYNRDRFEHPVVLSASLGALLSSANCEPAWYGPDAGGWGGYCRRFDPVADPTVTDARLRRDALRYVRHHTDRLPTVLGLRVLRQLGLWHPVNTARGDLLLDSSAQPVAFLATFQYWAYASLAIAGVVVLRRRRVPLLPLGAILVFTLLLAVGAYGTLRFRVPLDVVLPAPAAVALVALTDRLRARRRSPSEAPAPTTAA